MHNPKWACNIEGDFSLISGKDSPVISCEAWDYVRTRNPAIILLLLGTKHVQESQEMTKDKMSSNDIVWILKPFGFLVIDPKNLILPKPIVIRILSFTTLRILTNAEKDTLLTKKCTENVPAYASVLSYMYNRKKKFYDMYIENKKLQRGYWISRQNFSKCKVHVSY